MRVPPPRCAVLWIALFSAPGTAQTLFLIDFGDEGLQTGVQAQVWNDLHDQNWLQPLPLLDSGGNATSVSLDYPEPMGRAELSGVLVPSPGSELEQLGWPVSALGDSIGSSALADVPHEEFVLSGLDQLATYDFIIVGSVLENGVSLATEYTATGGDVVSTIGEIAQNTSEILRLRGIRPREDATITLKIRNATTNTSSDRRFYINALSMVEHPRGTQPLTLGFETNRLDVSRVVGKGPVLTTSSVYTSDGSTVAVALQAVDLGTGLTPTWLAVPATGVAGTPFSVMVDRGELAPGTYTAQLQADATGYVTFRTLVEFVVRDPGRLNLLYYGNSYTNANGMVPTLVERLAEEVGLDVPTSVPRLSSGKNLTYHLKPSPTEAISRSLPLGEEWDFVIVQGGTLEAAATVGNLPKFISDGLEIVANVRAHSADARVAIFQTWARGAGHSFYTGLTPSYPGPLDMHRELEDGNEQLAAAIDAVYGPGTVVISAAGETAALRGFDPAYYKMDLSHPAPALTAQTGSAMFSAIFGLATCDLALDFDTPGPVATHLASIGLVEDDWDSISGVADRAGSPALRPYPGSEEDLLLSSGPPGLLTACSEKAYPAGTKVRFELTSPAASFEGHASLIYVDTLSQIGGTTVLPPWSEIHVTPSATIEITTTALGPGGVSYELGLPNELVGHTILVQAMSEGVSENTGHSFSLTDAHAVMVLAPPLQFPQKKP